jgi:phage virion morphogenesis protein
MSGVSIRISFDALGAGAGLARLAAANRDLAPVMDAIGSALVESTRERFQTNIAPDGTAWLPSLRARTKGGRTLVDRGDLRGSVSLGAVGSDSVEVGAAKEYAAIHQMGFSGTVQVKAHPRSIRLVFGRTISPPRTIQVATYSRSARMPARPFLGISAEDREQIVGTVEGAWRLALAAGAAGPGPAGSSAP